MQVTDCTCTASQATVCDTFLQSPEAGLEATGHLFADYRINSYASSQVKGPNKTVMVNVRSLESSFEPDVPKQLKRNKTEKSSSRHTLVEACVVIAAVQPSPTLTVHEMVSPCKQRGIFRQYSNHI